MFGINHCSHLFYLVQPSSDLDIFSHCSCKKKVCKLPWIRTYEYWKKHNKPRKLEDQTTETQEKYPI